MRTLHLRPARLQYAPFKLAAQNQYLTALSSWSYVGFHWLYYDHFQFIMVSCSTTSVNHGNYRFVTSLHVKELTRFPMIPLASLVALFVQQKQWPVWRSFGSPLPKQKPVELLVTDPISSIDGTLTYMSHNCHGLLTVQVTKMVAGKERIMD